jgi:predicted nuclease of predicted toxin-antitoxin system
MIFLLDENIPRRVADFLIQNDHTVIDIRSTDREGSDDASIFHMAQEMKAIFITTDRDFFHTIPFLFKKHYGIIVISLRQPNGKGILEKVKWALGNVNLNELHSRVLLLKDSQYKIYGS